MVSPHGRCLSGDSGDPFSKVLETSLEMANFEVIPRPQRRTPVFLGWDNRELTFD